MRKTIAILWIAAGPDMNQLPPVTTILLVLLVSIAGWIDIRSRRISNWLTVAGVLVGACAARIPAVFRASRHGRGRCQALRLPHGAVIALGAIGFVPAVRIWGAWKLAELCGGGRPGARRWVAGGSWWVAGGTGMCVRRRMD